MKVVAFNGSPRIKGNTEMLIQVVFAELEKENIECEMVQVGGQLVRGCSGCYQCLRKQDQKCVLQGDIIGECIEKMKEADGIILATPTYFGNVTSELKALIDRAGMVSRANQNLLRQKVGAAVVAVRRSGANHVFNSINHFFFANEMIVPGSSYWNLGCGKEKGDVLKDEEGLITMKNLGINMAWLLQKIR